VLSAVSILQDLKVKKLRTALSWADWERQGGKEWFDWMIAHLHDAGIEIFPSLFYTPAHRAFLLPGETRADAKTCYPPERPKDYASFCEEMILHYGSKLSHWYQLWNEPNNDAYFSPRHDPDYRRFASIAHAAIDVFHAYGKKVVLGGIIPPYADWLRAMHRQGVVGRVDAVGIHAFPGTWDKIEWHGWESAIEPVRSMLSTQEVWITETGYSTVTLQDQSRQMQERREEEQVASFKEACIAPAAQVFWHSIHDQDLDHPTDNAITRGTCCDPRAYHFGLITREGRQKPLFEYWRRRAAGSAPAMKGA
jgi:CDP-paratose 2-epimerase